MLPAGPVILPRLPGPPHLTWHVPGSKSITNRALILAALADGVTELTGVLHSDDTRHMRSALEMLGIPIVDTSPTSLRVEGGRQRLKSPSAPLFIGNSGTSVRFLTALACLVDGPVTLVGDEAMARRPISDLLAGLSQLGVRFDCATGCPPLTIWGGNFAGGRLRMRGDRSSQYFSALLLVAGAAQRDLEIEIEGELVSRPYVEITRRMLTDFGIESESTETSFCVKSQQEYHARDYAIEPDASSASYPFALAAAAQGSICVPHLGLGSLQGDYGFVDVLAQLGAQVEKTPTYTRVSAQAPLRGIDLDMFHISDTVMTLAAIAPLLSGPTRIRNVANIRIKETDRLLATVTELQRLGQTVEYGADWLSITPRAIQPAVVQCYNDHRMAMSFAVLGACAGELSIEDPSCVTKTYPGFWADLQRAYASTGLNLSW